MPELNLDLMRELAKRADLELTDGELEELMPAVARNLERSKTLTNWVRPEVEPALGSPVGN